MEKDMLKLENQICFPLYACSKEIIRLYRPYLEKINLTYTQYIAMMVLWEHKKINIKNLGKYLYLDSGTITPVIKKLEVLGYVTKHRDKKDERNVFVEITPLGLDLKSQAENIPCKLRECIPLAEDEIGQLYKLLYKILDPSFENH